MRLAEAFDHHFASHLMGKIKPDEESFQHVLDMLHCDADEVLFLDDNQLNVEAAKRVGMRRRQPRSVKQMRLPPPSVGIRQDQHRQE
jgi:putative hydrolase of the HAD superfamily